MDEKDYKKLVENAPILEFDPDSAEQSKEFFFEGGKKPFEQFNKVKELGITKCLLFLPREFDHLTEIYDKCEKIYDFKSASTYSPVYLYDNKVLIALCPLGGPSSANLVEELHYVGIRTILSCGTCGCLDDNIDINHYFIPTDAIRDEGLSYHYLPAKRTVDTNDLVNSTIEEVLTSHNEKYIKGIIWTIDAMYRETPNRTARRKEEGAIAVDMECASLAACAKFNGINFGSLMFFSDRVDPKKWEWRFYDKYSLRLELVKLCLEILDKLPEKED